MIRFKRRVKSEEEVQEDIAFKADSNKAYRLSQEMRELASTLMSKAEQLERELEA